MELNQLVISEFDTMEEFMDSQVTDYNAEDNWVVQIEKEYPDVKVHFDVSLNELIEGTLIYNGFTKEEVLEMNHALYGKFVDLHKIVEDNFYIMTFGVR